MVTSKLILHQIELVFMHTVALGIILLFPLEQLIKKTKFICRP